MNDKIKELLNELNADGVKTGVDFKGYKIYEPVYDKPVYIGYPYIIMENDREVRLSTEQESVDYIGYKSHKR